MPRRAWRIFGSRSICMTAIAIWFVTLSVTIRGCVASLTEVIIGLLEEGPGTADEVAELIWRKRAAEHGGEL
jgi:hypothetical protein